MPLSVRSRPAWCQPGRFAHPRATSMYVVARRGVCSGMLTLPREDALADFSNHRGVWLVGWTAMRIGMGLTARVRMRLWGLGRRRAEGADYISKISSWPGSSRPRAPIAPPAASRATTEPWSRSTPSDSAAAVRPESGVHFWLSARLPLKSWPVPSAVQECNTTSRLKSSSLIQAVLLVNFFFFALHVMMTGSCLPRFDDASLSLSFLAKTIPGLGRRAQESLQV